MQSIVSRRDFRKLKNAVFVGCRAKALPSARDRKSTRLNSSHSQISYAVFCLKKKKIDPIATETLRLRLIFYYAMLRIERPFTFGAYDLTCGSFLTPCIYLAHRRPDPWPYSL